jgi:hypothetical protein
MLDALLGMLLIAVVLAAIAMLMFIGAGIRTIPEMRRIRRFAEYAATRSKLSDLGFCQRAELSEQDLPIIRKLRERLGGEISLDSELIYPEDELCTYGFQYDDSVSGFIQGCGLIEKDPHWFPMEQGSTIRDIFPWIHQINSEQDSGGNGGQRR